MPKIELEQNPVALDLFENVIGTLDKARDQYHQGNTKPSFFKLGIAGGMITALSAILNTEIDDA